MFLHIIVSQDPNKANAKKNTFLNFIWCDVRVYLHKKMCITMYSRMKIYIKIDWNNFLKK